MQARFGLIGKSLKHSFSATYFAKKFKKEGIQEVYANFELDNIEEFPGLISGNPQLIGLNVTIPYKSEIIPFLDECEPIAKKIGAVNTILFSGHSSRGYNTDIIGFKNSILPLIIGTKLKKTLILGTGGASKAIEFVLKEELHANEIFFVSRNPSLNNEISYSSLRNGGLKNVSLIVNTTPAGTSEFETELPDLPYQELQPSTILYDLVYNPAETNFMKKGREIGCKVKNGLEMLKIQAEAAWDIWKDHLGNNS